MGRRKRTVVAATPGGATTPSSASVKNTTTATLPKDSTWIAWIIGMVSGCFAIWLALLAIQALVVPTRLATTFIGLALLVLKIFFPLQYGPAIPILQKWKSLGADLAFASLSFDITMALGNVRLSDFGPIKINNPVWVYLIFGTVTFFSWILWMYPKTAAQDKPKAVHVNLSTFFGVVFYFGRILLYVLRG